jgi:hypothetical protein
MFIPVVLNGGHEEFGRTILCLFRWYLMVGMKSL